MWEVEFNWGGRVMLVNRERDSSDCRAVSLSFSAALAPEKIEAMTNAVLDGLNMHESALSDDERADLEPIND